MLKIIREPRVQAFCKVLATALGAFCVIALFARIVCGVWPHEIWLPASNRNDEVVYNRQLAAVLKDGVPQAQFGFNESEAEVGTFGAWGPAPFCMYALPALLMRGGGNMLLRCNLLLAVVGWTFFACAVKLDWKRQLLCGAAFFLFRIPLFYACTGMTECLHNTLLMLILGAAIACRQRYSRGMLAVLMLACAAETLVRPYGAVFWLFPLLVVWQKRSKVGIALCFVGGGASLLGSAWMIMRATAPYFFSRFDFGPLYLLRDGKILKLVQSLCGKAYSAWKGAIVPALFNQSRDTVIYGAFFLLLAVTVALWGWDVYHKRPIYWKSVMLICVLLIFLTLIVMYPAEASRHCIVLVIGMILVLAVEDRNLLALALVPLALLWVLTPDFGEELPRYDAALDSELQTIHAALAQSQQELGPQATRWDRTLAYSYLDDASYQYLYGLPDGMGIEFDLNTYLAEEENEIRSRYVMTSAGSEVEARLLAEQWQPLLEEEQLVIYQKAN